MQIEPDGGSLGLLRLFVSGNLRKIRLQLITAIHPFLLPVIMLTALLADVRALAASANMEFWTQHARTSAGMPGETERTLAILP